MLKRPNSHVISNTIEHPAILKVLKHLNHLGLDYSLINVDGNGLVNFDEINSCITSKTRLVSIMMSNNEIGTIQPLKSIIKLIRDKSVLMHTDAVQCLGKILVDVKDLDVDFLSLSAHKFYGPKGIGILYVKDRKTIESLLIGGSQRAD